MPSTPSSRSRPFLAGRQSKRQKNLARREPPPVHSRAPVSIGRTFAGLFDGNDPSRRLTHISNNECRTPAGAVLEKSRVFSFLDKFLNPIVAPAEMIPPSVLE